ncbi:Interleukin-28B [Pteropus alecto]|uniref:Interleukin-28B n=1 Tax=Pteropus alecto TaxID=9402 RepID=L5KMR8_PTEAL|nr:Interleukin-28B [Pteropus alecto]
MYSSHLCPVSPRQVWERPVALEAELALTLKVLETVANSTLGDILDQPLSMLRHIHARLQACESQGCLEASVTFNLFRLLTLDLKCVASGDLKSQNWSCSSRPFPRTRDLKQLQVWERPVALEAELALTLKVLETVANSTLGDILDQPLSMLRHIHARLQACESQGCLEASVTFNLFRLLTLDLKCVASGDLCV